MRARSITNKARKNGVFLDDQELIKMIRLNVMLEIAKRNLEFVRICEKKQRNLQLVLQRHISKR